jgi:hypothetical protein
MLLPIPTDMAALAMWKLPNSPYQMEETSWHAPRKPVERSRKSSFRVASSPRTKLGRRHRNRDYACPPESVISRQNNSDFGELAGLRIDLYRSRMLLHDDVVTNGQAKSGALSGWFGREEGIEHFLLYLERNAGAIIPNYDLYAVAEVLR